MNDKQKYQQKLEAQMNLWRAEIDLIKAKSENSKIEAKQKYHEELQKLNQKQAEAEKKLNELKHASGEAWKDLKSGLNSALNSLEKSLKSAKSRFD